jgi:uncharacterized membrane protein
MIESVLVVAIVIVCTIWYMRERWRRHLRDLATQHNKELELLGERYARGEITRQQYLLIRGDIIGYPLVAKTRAGQLNHWAQ